MKTTSDDQFPEIRDAVRALCAQFPDEYHRKIDEARGYPEEFVQALTQAGWMAALIPQEYGGSGLSMAEASVIMEEINRSGGNSGACHGQMYVMNAIVRSGSEAQKQQYLPKIASGELRIQSMGVTEPTTGSDTTQLKTTAVKKDGRWVINGQKVWISQPASFCGLTGIKPTYGRASRYGMIAFASSLDQAGPLARTAEDCALLLSSMCGADAERDSTSLDVPPEDFTHKLNLGLDGLRIGLPKEFFGDGLAPDVRAAIDQALAELRKLGARVVDISLPRTELAIPVYYIIAPAEASSNLARFDGVKFGHRAERYADLEDMYKKTRAEGFGDEVKRRIMTGTYVLSHGYYDAYYLQAQKLRRMIADDFQAAFQQCDVIAGPVAPTVAWALGAQRDPLADYLADIDTLPASLAGLPGMSVPAGFGAGGLPVGLQLIGNYLQESRLLNVAHRLQQATDWHLRRPEGF